MRIAQIAPLYESVPPQRYGGTERVVSYLTEELVRRGHEVTLFASGDSVTSATLRPACDRALRLRGEAIIDPLACHVRMLEMVAAEAENFDLIHYHIDYLHFPVTRRQQTPSVTTLHGRLNIPELHPLFREFQDMPLVSISNAQRLPVPVANWAGTVYHGLPPDLIRVPNAGVERKYLAFLGRICPEKGVDRAIEIARRARMPLKIAAKVDPADRKYFETEIRALLDDPLVDYVGEIGELEKPAFLGNAHAVLFPIDWPEPFGLVLIESMAAGTPVIAYKMGSVPEIVEDGVTGYLVHGVEDAVKAVERAGALDRRVCRRRFEERFSVQRMCQDYEKIFRRLTAHQVPGQAEMTAGTAAIFAD